MSRIDKLKKMWLWMKKNIIDEAHNIKILAEQLDINDSIDIITLAKKICDRAYAIIKLASQLSIISYVLEEVNKNE